MAELGTNCSGSSTNPFHKLQWLRSGLHKEAKFYGKPCLLLSKGEHGRNETEITEGKGAPLYEVLLRIKSSVIDWGIQAKEFHSVSISNFHRSWAASIDSTTLRLRGYSICMFPEVRGFKLNIDGNFEGNPGSSDKRGVITDDDGCIVLIFSSPIGEVDANRAEILVIKQGIIWISVHFTGCRQLKATQSMQQLG